MSYEYVGYNEYPKAIYHATEGTKVVADRAEQDSYGDGWQETPVYPTDPSAEVSAPEPVAEPVKPKRGRPAKASKPAKTDETADSGAAGGE
jgi:hypothetical protein